VVLWAAAARIVQEADVYIRAGQFLEQHGLMRVVACESVGAQDVERVDLARGRRVPQAL